MQIGVLSEDARLCNELAVMCSKNNFAIVFINQDNELINTLDYIVIDIDLNTDLAINICEEYSRLNLKIFGATSTPTKLNILNAKKAGCLMVLTKSNFAANLEDIINKSIKNI